MDTTARRVEIESTGGTLMPTVHIPNEKKYAKAIGLLLEMGGIFRTKPVRQLVIGPGQLQVLQAAGVVPKANGATKRAKKTWPVHARP
jgi:hypothetical protein